MTDPLRSEDFPRFDTNPGPESRETAGGSSLQATAEQIGNTMGRAIRVARNLPERVGQVRQDLRDRLTVIRGGAGPTVLDKASQLKAADQRSDCSWATGSAECLLVSNTATTARK